MLQDLHDSLRVPELTRLCLFFYSPPNLQKVLVGAVPKQSVFHRGAAPQCWAAGLQHRSWLSRLPLAWGSPGRGRGAGLARLGTERASAACHERHPARGGEVCPLGKS